MKEKPSHEPEENASVSFEPNTGRTTLWLQLAALCRPVKWRCVDKLPITLPACCCKDFIYNLKPSQFRLSLSSSGLVL